MIIACQSFFPVYRPNRPSSGAEYTSGCIVYCMLSALANCCFVHGPRVVTLVGVDARDGINSGLHALLAVVLCFTVLTLFIVIVNIIYWWRGKKQPQTLQEQPL